MEVVAIEPFKAKCQAGEYHVGRFDRFKVLSGFQILKMQDCNNTIVICPEEYLHTKLREDSGFIKERDMEL